MESGLNSVAAGQTVAFAHTSFDGVVTFMITDDLHDANNWLCERFWETKCNNQAVAWPRAPPSSIAPFVRPAR
jgi:hypothetical protein